MNNIAPLQLGQCQALPQRYQIAVFPEYLFEFGLLLAVDEFYIGLVENQVQFLERQELFAYVC